jgi:uncharacterized protein YbbK (DUF523 family)
MRKKPSSSAATRPRVGISRCLLGDNVRHDGGHKHAPVLLDTLSPFVEWVAVCPEVEVGMGVPREPIRLVGSPSTPRLVAVDSGRDFTRTMRRFSRQRIKELAALKLSGYVFKSDSPSCGMERVPVIDARGRSSRAGVGVFARAVMRHFPQLPVAEEGDLRDPATLERFLERVVAFHLRNRGKRRIGGNRYGNKG